MMLSNSGWKGASLRLFLLLFLSFGAVFTFQAPAIEKTLRLAPLANGWVSEKAVLHLSSMSLLEKYQKTVSHDLGVGRFRPASFIYTSLAYALSPLIHDRRINDNEKRAYHNLVTGNLRLMSSIYLVTMSLAICGMSLLIYFFTGSVLVSIVPIFFISSSPALTGNLLQNYIDSQEIPLTIALSIWTFFFFLGLKNSSTLRGGIYCFLSILFIFLVFLTKETSCIMAVSLLISCIFLFFKRNNGTDRGKLKNERMFYGVNMLLSFILACYVYFKVVADNTQYGTGYSMLDWGNFLNNFNSNWDALSLYSVNHYFTIFLFFIALILVLWHRRRYINDISVDLHATLLFVMVSAGYGFFLIQIPWQYSLVKYFLPSIFFISFAVSLSIVIISNLSFPRYKEYVKLSIVMVYVIIFINSYDNVKKFTVWYYENSTYGSSIIDDVVSNIDETLLSMSKRDFNIFIEYGTDVDWGRFVPWGKLHLMRILNLENGYNIIDKYGNKIVNVSMPEYELSSFVYNCKNKNIYLTNRREEFSERIFDILYKGYGEKNIPPEVLRFNNDTTKYKYIKTDEYIRYTNNVGLPEFTLYKYIPVR